MKNYILLLFALTTLPFLSCKKNEKRIIGTWTVVKVTKGSTDLTSVYADSGYRETYGSNGSFAYTGQPTSIRSGSGKYSWNDKTTFKRYGVSGQTSVTCTNVNVDKKSLNYSYTDNGEVWTFQFKK